ncbi:MAG: hypothetical protein RLZ04_1207 [Actinomycetota bacterium]
MDRDPLDSRRLVVSDGRRIVSKICTLAAVMAASAVALVVLLPEPLRSVRSSGWWMVPLLAALYAVAERTVFHFEFRREAISFSISEVPTAFALIFLAPGQAIIARLVGSLLVIAFQWRSRFYKQLFNAALFVLELAVAFQVTQVFVRQFGSTATVLLPTVAVAAAISFVIGSILVSVAISIVEGDLWNRIRGELRVTAWVAPLNSTVATALAAPALLSPVLIALSAVPLVAFWAMMRGYGTLEQRYRDLDELHGFVRRVGPTLDLDELVTVTAAETAERLRATRVGFVAFDGPRSVRRHDIGEPLPQLPIAADDPRWVDVVAHGRSHVLTPAECHPRALHQLAALKDILVAPIVDRGATLGLLVVAEREGAEARFQADDVARLGRIADQLAPNLRKAMFHQRIEFEARHDALTGLPNRASFERHVQAAIERRIPTLDGFDDIDVDVVVMMDLDRFKEVNDTLGHHAGDDLLRQFAERLTDSLECGDFLARLAGDEFAVLARRKIDDIERLAEHLVSEARRPFSIDGLEVVVTASSGVAVISGDIDDAMAVLRRADIAMYAAKSQHTGVETYRPDIDRRTPARLSMLGDLRAALENHDLVVHLQPKLDLTTSTVIGVEALARWVHPVRGFVSPEDFVHVAEETGLIKQLTDDVLEMSIDAISRLHRQGHHLSLAVNLSTHDLLDEQLPDRVLRRLEHFGVDPAMLTLEITESALLIDAPRSRATIDRLHRMGIRLSIDDFGTGYSSLSYLRHLPVSELKIDRSFVSNLLLEHQDEVIVRSIIDLGHNLGLQVTAEGVETDEIMGRLRSFGCDEAQGYGVCRPVPYEQFLTWLGTTEHPSRRRNPMEPSTWTDRPQ